MVVVAEQGFQAERASTERWRKEDKREKEREQEQAEDEEEDN